MPEPAGGLPPIARSTWRCVSRSYTSARLPTSSDTSTFGWPAMNAFRSGGTTYSPAVVTAARRSARTSRISRSAWSRSPSSSAAYLASVSPAGVSMMPRPCRVTSSTPRSRCSAPTAADTAGSVTTSAAAAPRTEPARASARNVFSWPNVIARRGYQCRPSVQSWLQCSPPRLRVEWIDATPDHPWRRGRLRERQDHTDAGLSARARPGAGLARLPRRLSPLRPLTARRHGRDAARPWLQPHGHHGPAPDAAAPRRGDHEAGLPALGRNVRAARLPHAGSLSDRGGAARLPHRRAPRLLRHPRLPRPTREPAPPVEGGA